jgi:hypothetical protein
MIRVLAAASAGLAILLSACAGGSPEQKMMNACMRMNKGADIQSNCTCIVTRLREKLTDEELSALADQVNEVFDRAGDNGEAAGLELGRRIKDKELVNQKVGDEFVAASKACPAGAAPTTAPPPTP